jgi:hypothetical protein
MPCGNLHGQQSVFGEAHDVGGCPVQSDTGRAVHIVEDHPPGADLGRVLAGGRADARDDWKLANWDDYLKRRVQPPSHASLRRFDNQEFDPTAFDLLIDHLLS